jgi:hypothetical protein
MNKLKHILAAITIAALGNASIALADVSPLHNPINGLDVDSNSRINSRDALLVISVLLHPQEDMSANAMAATTAPQVFYWDTSNDNRINARDALLVISYLTAVPEPTSLTLCVLGLPGLAGYAWRCRRRRRSR